MKIFVVLSMYWFAVFTSHAHLLKKVTAPQSQSGYSSAIINELKEGSLSYIEVTYDHRFLFTYRENTESYPDVKSVLSLDLFLNEPLDIQSTQHFFRADGKLVWLGKVRGDENSKVNLIATKSSLTGTIKFATRLFQIRTLKNKKLVLLEMQAKEHTETDVLVSNEPAIQPLSKQQKTSRSNFGNYNGDLGYFSVNQNGFTGEPNVNVLVYYTTQHLEEMPDLLDMIDLEFVDTNSAFENSLIDVRVSVVGKIAVDDLSISASIPLYSMRDAKGPFADIEQARDKFDADLVHLYDTEVGFCGRAFYVAYPNGNILPERAFGTTSPFCLGSYVTAHELGHNFGAKHDRYVEDEDLEESNFGYVDVVNDFRTIMAYDDECDDLVEPLDCDRVAHFSNPNVDYLDAVTGIENIEVDSANNADMINFSGLTLANFRGVDRPTITSISQGESDDSITVKWTEVPNSTRYKLSRTIPYLADSEEQYCPSHSSGFYFSNVIVFTSDTSFTTNDALSNGLYCFSVEALNDNLISEPQEDETYQNFVTSPSSFAKSGYVATETTRILPFIEDLVFEHGELQYADVINLPSENMTYRVELVEYNGLSAPTLDLKYQTDGEYLLTLDDFTSGNQSLSFIIIAESDGVNVATQQAYIFIKGAENQVPEILGDTSLSMQKFSTLDVGITVSDDQVSDVENLYVYSTNVDIINAEDISVSMPVNGNYVVSIHHDKLPVGEVELVIGYSDGEYSAEHLLTVNVEQASLTQPILKDVTWYAEPGLTIERLLPYYDGDYQEEFEVTLASSTNQGVLTFENSLLVTYTPDSSFAEDSFQFVVTGEDELVSDVATVSIKPKSEEPTIRVAQKLVSDTSRTALLTEDGRLFVWGVSQSIGVGEALATLQDDIYAPTEISGSVWADVAFSEKIFAIQVDGTLWSAGYNSNSKHTDYNFVQEGSDNDWRTVSSYTGDGETYTSIVLTKSDGSVWGWGDNSDNSLSDRVDFISGEEALAQLQPVYSVETVLSEGTSTHALNASNELYSWGIETDKLGRVRSLGYLGLLDVFGELSFLANTFSKGYVLSDQTLYGWGTSLDELFSGAPEQTQFMPVVLDDSKWLAIGVSSDFFAGVKVDGTLWTSGPSGQAMLARGDNAQDKLTQVSDRNDWVNVWVGENALFVLDATGQLWAAGGELDATNSHLGLGEVLTAVNTLTEVNGLPELDTSVDTDGDGIFNQNDPDDDNDGVEDSVDAFPLDHEESLDTDRDGIGNNADRDDDGDGVEDNIDAFPLDSGESADTDEDGIGNNADSDDDGDGIEDNIDAFPLDSDESTDTDEDGIGNNADSDDDGDGIEDNIDAFPLDSDESVDTDGDGIGNNADSDDDDDGVNDSSDAFPLDASRSENVTVVPSNNSNAGGGGAVFWLLLLFGGAIGVRFKSS